MRLCVVASRHQEQKEWHADSGGQGANRKLPWRENSPRKRIRDDEQAAARQCRSRDNNSVIAAGEQPYQMRYDQTDEADHAHRGNRKRSR